MEQGEDVVISPGRSASFEITRDGVLLYSKLETHRIPEDDQVRALASG